MRELATVDDVADLGYDPIDSAMIFRASVRVFGYLSGRSSASSLFDDDAEVPLPVIEIVCSIANRMVNTSDQVLKGVQAESFSGDSVTWGAQAYAGTADLIPAEKSVLDRLYPRTPSLIYTDPT